MRTKYLGHVRLNAVLTLIWCLVVLAHIRFGLLETVKIVNVNSMPPMGQRATTDSWLQSLQIPNPSELILAGLADIPTTELIVFVGPDNEPRFKQIFYTISYLSWPRPVSAIRCGGLNQASIQVRPPKNVPLAGIIYYRLPPPQWLPSGVPIGPNMVWIPYSEKRRWNSYCP